MYANCIQQPAAVQLSQWPELRVDGGEGNARPHTSVSQASWIASCVVILKVLLESVLVTGSIDCYASATPTKHTERGAQHVQMLTVQLQLASTNVKAALAHL